MKPTIINKDSNFVVITYWWGRGVPNKNTQRPCPEDLEEGMKIRKKPITYNKMIDNWIDKCKKAKCNYMAVEYPEFAQKGMYQIAINFKPKFIQEALDACYPRAVLYIDGDMHVQKYPKLFDIPDVDYMAMGWNSDPRYGILWNDKACYSPYVFETSGGIMYFNQTGSSFYLLKEWEKSVKKFPKKAEDRLISQVFNRKKLLLSMTTIQLPIEYLWLSIDYDQDLPRKQIIIEHPECLTGEDRAYAEGSAKERFPPRYAKEITDLIRCNMRNMPFYEYIFFPQRSDVSSLKQYLTGMDKLKFFDVVPYSDRYGKFNEVYEKNKKKMKDIYIKKNKHVIITSKNHNLPNEHVVCNKNELVPTILKYLENGIDVSYYPKFLKNAIDKISFVHKNTEIEFICRNASSSIRRYKKDYTLAIDDQYPMYFSSKSDVLIHLLRMSSTLNSVSANFNSSFIFPSRIHCKWI